jgi:pimeloyl-ACP methyl ester carboxylesterase
VSVLVGESDLKYLENQYGVRIAYRRRDSKQEDRKAGGVERSQSRPELLWLSGFRSDMDGNKANAVDAFAGEWGVAATRFDCTGHGHSDGDFEQSTLSTWLADAELVFNEVTLGPQVLVGSSMGGWLAMLLALRYPKRVSGLVLIAPAPDFTEAIWRELLEDERAHLESGKVLYQPSQYDDEPYPITPQLIEDGKRHLLLGGPIGIKCPIRILHGMADPDVPWEQSLKLARLLASDDLETHFFWSGDHRLSGSRELDALEDALRSLLHVRYD